MPPCHRKCLFSNSDSICNLARKGLIRATKGAFSHIYAAQPRFACRGSPAYWFAPSPILFCLPFQKKGFGYISPPHQIFLVTPPPLRREGSFWAGHHLPRPSHLTPPWVSVIPTRYSGRVSLKSQFDNFFLQEGKKTG